MEHLVKLLRDSYDLQEEKSEETAYWHLQKLRSEIKQLTLTDVVKPFFCWKSKVINRKCKKVCDVCKGTNLKAN
jgi:hypothetical protein